MKKTYFLIAAIMLLCFDLSAQTFQTGTMGVNVSQYGRIRLLTPAGLRHLQRASILVGTSPTTVFDYTNDANPLDATAVVANPTSSNFEIYGSYNNTYSNLPPNVIVKLNVYGWTNGSYAIAKFNVRNNETTAISATIGLDIIPELGQAYGFDTVTYNSTAGVIRFHRGTVPNMGIKLLSANLTSLFSFEWFTGYTTDANYWTNMNKGSLQPRYISTTLDGPVTITAQAPISLNPGESRNVFYAFAVGANEQAMLTNISEAVQKYQTLITSIDEPDQNRNGLYLWANYPNPFHQETSVTYQLPGEGFVSVKIYDVFGKEVATLKHEKQAAGLHTVNYDSKNLPAGMYSCVLRFKDEVMSRKMILTK